jgi:hypothetical protein
MVAKRNISIVPNLTYQINVGAGGAVNQNGQDSYLLGFDDNDIYPIQFYAGGGNGATFDGGNSGTGSIVRAGSVVETYTVKTGGTGAFIINAFGGQYAAGGGASNTTNGGNGTVDPPYKGGDGGSGDSSGGGGGSFFAGPTGAYGNAGVSGAGTYGRGGNGFSTIQNGVVEPRQATAGADGAVVISYPGKQKAFVTNAVTTFSDGNTIHTFNSGSGTFIYTYPYPYEEPATPYQVIECPEEKNGFAPYINPDQYSGSIVSAIPGQIFKQGYDNLFGMVDIWDDISSYVRGTGVPTGSDRTISPTGSAIANITSAITTPWDIYGYNTSLLMPTNTALNAGTDTGIGVGFNVATSSWYSSSVSASQFDWVAEAWVQLPVSSSFTKPLNAIVSKLDSYNLSLFSGGPFDDAIIYKNPFSPVPKYSGALTASAVIEVAGPNPFAGDEQLLYPTSSAASTNIPAGIWYHIAFSAENLICGEVVASPNRYTIYRGFINGNMVMEQAINLCGTGENARPNPIQYRPTSPAVLLGSVSNEALFQDFRFYNGTNKNYTSSFDVSDVYPIVIARPY